MCPCRVRSAEPPAVVRQREVEQRTDRHDAGRVDVAVAAVIVPLDVIETDGVGDARHLIKIAQIIPQIWIVDDAPQIAFEVAVIDGVEANERREQPPIRFRDLPPDQITLP